METGDLAALQADLGPNYRVERELGSGGMATVYLARDVKHERPVALKVLRPELAAYLGVDRFRREIKVAANLQHPRIVTVLDSGETRSGLLWFTMPFVDGETLRARLRRDRQLPIAEAIRITRDIADALQYAHDRGIIHRDVKPENILLSGGHALLADFGVARPMAPTPRSAVTDPGFAVGTLAYASPEQAAALPVDARADVYSLGAVCYEMLTGEQPYPGSSGLAALAQQITTSAPLVRTRRTDVPVALERVVRTALSAEPAKRFASAREFAAALDVPAPPRSRPIPRLIVASLAIACVLAGVGVTFALRARAGPTGQGGATSPNVEPSPTIAVLPFENIGDAATEYFAEGVSDEVRIKLGSVPGLRVIAATSSVQYRHTSKPPQQVARELGAHYLLTGRVHSETLASGRSRVRVEPELVRVDATTAPTTRWHQSFDADLSDVFQVQTAIADTVSAALNVALGAAQRQQMTAQPTTSLAAYDAYLRGEAATGGMSAGDPPSLRRGAEFYARAAAIDTTFAAAWARLAYAHAVLFFNTGPSPGEKASTESALRHVESLAPGRPEAQLALAWTALLLHNDYQASLAAAQVGLAAAPSNAGLLTVAGFAQRSLGQWDQALTSFAAAEALDPQSADAANEWGRTLHSLRRLPEAQSAFEHALALAPTNVGTVEDLVMVSLSRGDLADARLIIRTALATVDTSALAAHFATYYDLYWALDNAEQLRVLALTPSDFDGDRALWNLTRAEVSWLRGDTTTARRFAAGAEHEYAQQVQATPNDDQRRVYHGLSLAYRGRKQAAIAEAERGVALRSADAFNGPAIEQVEARILVIVGEHDRAIDHLQHLLAIPHVLTPAWLAIDPNWAPLRNNARFARLVSNGARGEAGHL